MEFILLLVGDGRADVQLSDDQKAIVEAHYDFTGE
jgi:hypothetical protein